ncbi:hypothetical protein C8T65DRAFT_145675 [Cerioporus squamosus]|nr:hypothetical protein C8T65DRAFT_145675 [Cerioporus squamosus]
MNTPSPIESARDSSSSTTVCISNKPYTSTTPSTISAVAATFSMSLLTTATPWSYPEKSTQGAPCSPNRRSSSPRSLMPDSPASTQDLSASYYPRPAANSDCFWEATSTTTGHNQAVWLEDWCHDRDVCASGHRVAGGLGACSC